MNDLINRQAAIDLFPNDALEWDTKGGYVAPHLVRRMIEKLPSAQPEIIRCKDCKHRPTIDGEWENGFDVEFPDGRCPCQCEDGWYNWMPRDDWFCGNGERK